TARDAVEDRVRGLDLGADDYVAKPVSFAELAARLRAVTRRALGAASGVLTIGNLSIDPAERKVTFRGEPVDLQARQFALLDAMASGAGRVLPRSQLEALLYEWDRGLDSNAIEVYVHHLRRRPSPALIRTVRGVGYVVPRDA